MLDPQFPLHLTLDDDGIAVATLEAAGRANLRGRRPDRGVG
ncbi:MAG: hypothetical protein PW843_07290 [Azospirillaceae bacterium]|nr:hypothetical protein [Azospirillaceae bacterium]